MKLRYAFLLVFCISGVIARGQLREITLEELYGDSAKFVPKSVSYPYSLRDGKTYVTLEEERGLIQWSFATGLEERALLRFEELPDSLRDVESYAFSADERFVLLETGRELLYRRSWVSSYWIFDMKTRELRPLSEGGKQRLPKFSPDGKSVAFVRDNNLFYVDVQSMVEKQLTFDGEQNAIINGAADWVYEEEFALGDGYWWSPDSKQIAFLRFDERGVREYSMMYYANSLYPSVYSYKYPKAGEANSVVTLHVCGVASGQVREIETGQEKDQYIPRVVWSPMGGLCWLRLNRLQNHIELFETELSSYTSRLVFEESDSCYIEEPTDWYLTFLDGGKRFVVPSERSGTRQLYIGNWDGSGSLQALTSGDDEVLEVYGYSDKTERLYYRAYDGTPLRTALFSVKKDGTARRRMSQEVGANTAWFNSAMTYYIASHSSVERVPLYTLCTIDGRKVRVLEDNKALRDTLAEYSRPTKRFFSFVSSDGVQLNGYMVLPVGFDSMMVYPVMQYQYSGPNSQEVLDRWRMGWDEYLASKGCLVVCVDGRGTGGRGSAFRKCTYGQLGNLESRDQIATAEYLSRLSFVDEKRIAIWGWSFGGYMSLLSKFRSGDLFRCCVAVAPVTNWRFYDNIYTERFMGLPSTNARGYDDNSPLNFVKHFTQGLLLIHGTYDDNVHVQHSMRLVEELIRERKQFEMQLYPDRNHGIRGKGATLHLFERIWTYVCKELF
ncbi:MAG: S9 family peptidase [Bacteroides sp.]